MHNCAVPEERPLWSEMSGFAAGGFTFALYYCIMYAHFPTQLSSIFLFFKTPFQFLQTSTKIQTFPDRPVKSKVIRIQSEHNHYWTPLNNLDKVSGMNPEPVNGKVDKAAETLLPTVWYTVDISCCEQDRLQPSAAAFFIYHMDQSI